MRKILILFIILALGIMLSGCGETQKIKGNDEVVTPDITAIKDRGVLRVGIKVDVPKFGYKDPETGKKEGFEVDIAKAIAKAILGDENKVRLRGVNTETRERLLDKGEVDIVAATFSITEERKKSYNFSEPYFVDGVGLLVKKVANIKSLKDLDGKKIGVAQSSTSKDAVQVEADKLGIKVNFIEFDNYPEIKSALEAGRIDCFSVDTAILLGYIDDSTVILPDRFSPQSYGVASKKGNDGLAKIVNDTVVRLKSSGELDKLIKKWELK